MGLYTYCILSQLGYGWDKKANKLKQPSKLSEKFGLNSKNLPRKMSKYYYHFGTMIQLRLYRLHLFVPSIWISQNQKKKNVKKNVVSAHDFLMSSKCGYADVLKRWIGAYENMDGNDKRKEILEK